MKFKRNCLKILVKWKVKVYSTSREDSTVREWSRSGIVGIWAKEKVFDNQSGQKERFVLLNRRVYLISEMSLRKYLIANLSHSFTLLLQKSVVFWLIIDGQIIKLDRTFLLWRRLVITWQEKYVASRMKSGSCLLIRKQMNKRDFNHPSQKRWVKSHSPKKKNTLNIAIRSGDLSLIPLFA